MARKVWITRYALTEGVKQCCVDSVSGSDSKYVYVQYYDRAFTIQCVLGSTCFDTEEEARANVVKQVDRKLKSIEKQKAKLLALRAEHAKKDGVS